MFCTWVRGQRGLSLWAFQTRHRLGWEGHGESPGRSQPSSEPAGAQGKEGAQSQLCGYPAGPSPLPEMGVHNWHQSPSKASSKKYWELDLGIPRVRSQERSPECLMFLLGLNHYFLERITGQWNLQE